MTCTGLFKGQPKRKLQWCCEISIMILEAHREEPCTQHVATKCFSVACFLVCRTKRFLSSPDFQPDKFLYLPASVAQEVASASPPPGTRNWVVCEHVILAISNPWQSTSMTQWTPRVMRTRHCESMPTSYVKALALTLQKTYQMSIGLFVSWPCSWKRPEANRLFAWTARLLALRIWPTMCMVDSPF